MENVEEEMEREGLDIKILIGGEKKRSVNKEVKIN